MESTAAVPDVNLDELSEEELAEVDALPDVVERAEPEVEVDAESADWDPPSEEEAARVLSTSQSDLTSKPLPEIKEPRLVSAKEQVSEVELSDKPWIPKQALRYPDSVVQGPLVYRVFDLMDSEHLNQLNKLLASDVDGGSGTVNVVDRQNVNAGENSFVCVNIARSATEATTAHFPYKLKNPES